LARTHERDLVGVVHEPVEDGVGDGAIAEIGMPPIERQLAGDEDRGAIVSIVEDLQQVAHRLIGERRETEVVDDE
jgi:hypothetical protein